MELFLKYPNDVQNELLFKLLFKAKNTEIGLNHKFDTINSYADFVKNVPIQQYESIQPLIERTRKGEQNVFWPTPINWFAKSSGTTNAKSKYIPVSDEAIEDCHFKGGKDKALGFLVGQAMKETKGKANPQMLNKMLKKELSK